jgi:predicted RNA-binding protein YlqC (UPF0109 family)
LSRIGAQAVSGSTREAEALGTRAKRQRKRDRKHPLSCATVEVPMKELIIYIAKHLVDKPDLVEVNEVEGERTSVIELKVAKEDLGKVIGKQGRTARALRTILSAASTKIRKRSVLEILE